MSIWIYSVRDQVDGLASFGYPGVFIIAILANATVILPAPTLAIVFAMGGITAFNPFLVGIIAGIGSGIGELTGYLAGYSGQAIIERIDIYKKITPYIKKYEVASILVLAALPNPFFDLVGIAAGVLRVPIHTFLLWCIAGKIIKMLLFSYAGAYSIIWILA